VLAANFLVAEHKKATLNAASVSGILALQGKFARELYRRAVECGELSVQIDNRTYLIEPTAYNEVELIEIPGGEGTH
jgi:glutamine amidotransferase PdxT